METNSSGRFDAAVVPPGSADLGLVAQAVRRYIYIPGADGERELSVVRGLWPHATARRVGSVLRIDVGAPGYLIREGAAS